MAVFSALDNQTQAQLKDMGTADIVVGIPSYNNSQTIRYVAEVVAEGFSKFFKESKCLLMNSDGGSTDGTRDVFMKTPVPMYVHMLSTQYQGLPGKGSALKAIFEACVMSGARACVVVDSDLRSITPEWIHWLAEPVISEGAGYVTPLYLRHKYDGTITNSLAYPFTRALYGKRVRQPIGGDFGLSRKLAESYLEKDIWGTDAAKYGIDIFMTTTAINEGFDIRQAHLGAKIHDTKDPAAQLGPMFKQVVGTMFSLMKTYENKWISVRVSKPVPAVGPQIELEPPPVAVTLTSLIDRFKEGVKTSKPLWNEFLSQDTMKRIERLSRRGQSSFEFPASLWVRIVYEFAVACNAGEREPDTLIESLTPLYFGRTAGFVIETENLSSTEAENVIEGVAELFEKEKPYLLSLWEKK